MLTAAELRVGVHADTSRLGPGLRQGDAQVKAAGSRQAGVFKSAFSVGIGTIGAQLATQAIGKGIGFITGGIAKLREEGALVAQTTAVLRSTGAQSGVTARQIDNLSDSIKNLTGIQDEEVRRGANLLLTFTNIKNAAGAGNDIFTQTTKSAVDLSVALGQDIKSSAIQLGKALNDPIKGVTALRRVGVAFDDQQIKAIKTAVKHNDILKAQKIILAEVNKEFGGSAAAFGASDAGKAAKMANAIEDAQKAIAKGLLPGVSAFQQSITKTLTNPATLAALTEFGKTLGETLGSIPWGSIAQGLGMIANALKVAVGALNALPGPLKSGVLALLIGSRLPIIGAPIRGAVGGVLGLPGAIISGILGRGRGGGVAGTVAGAASGATPVMVVNWPPGLGAGGIAGDVLAGGGKGGPIARMMARVPILGSLMSGGGVLAAILPFVPAIAAASIAVALASVAIDTWARVTKQGQDVQAQATKWGSTASAAQLRNARAGVQGQLNALDPITRQFDLGGARTSIERTLAIIDADIRAADQREGARAAKQAAISGRDPLAMTIRTFLTEFRREGRAGKVADLHQAQNTVNTILKHGGLGGSLTTLPSILKTLQRDRAKALKAGDTVAVKGFDKLIAAVKERIKDVQAGAQRRIAKNVRSAFDIEHRGDETGVVPMTAYGRAQRAHAGTDKPVKLAADPAVRGTQRNTRDTVTAIKLADPRATIRAETRGVAGRIAATTAAVNAVATAVRTALHVSITPSPVTITLDGRAIGASQVRYESARNPAGYTRIHGTG